MQKIKFNGNIKKKKLIDTILKSTLKVNNKFLILQLIDDGDLDCIINKIESDKIYVLKSPINPNGYLTGYEQFINILDNFITYVLNYLNSYEMIKEIISNCIKNSNILLSKKYFYDTENIEYFKYNYNLLIVKIFYNNLIILKNELQNEMNQINLNIEQINLNNKKDASYLTTILSEIVLINKNDYKILSLFTSINKNKYDLYYTWYKILLSKYIKNMDFINAYRNFNNNY